MSHHTGVNLHCYDFLGLFQQLHGQVASTRPNFQHYICALDACLVHDRLQDQGVLEDMLPLAFQKLQACAKEVLSRL